MLLCDKNNLCVEDGIPFGICVRFRLLQLVTPSLLKQVQVGGHNLVGRGKSKNKIVLRSFDSIFFHRAI